MGGYAALNPSDTQRDCSELDLIQFCWRLRMLSQLKQLVILNSRVSAAVLRPTIYSLRNPQINLTRMDALFSTLHEAGASRHPARNRQR